MITCTFICSCGGRRTLFCSTHVKQETGYCYKNRLYWSIAVINHMELERAWITIAKHEGFFFPVKRYQESNLFRKQPTPHSHQIKLS